MTHPLVIEGARAMAARMGENYDNMGRDLYAGRHCQQYWESLFDEAARVLLSAEPTEGMVVAVEESDMASTGIKAANAALLAELTKPRP